MFEKPRPFADEAEVLRVAVPRWLERVAAWCARRHGHDFELAGIESVRTIGESVAVWTYRCRVCRYERGEIMQ